MNLPVEKRRQWIRSRREQRKLTRLARLRRQFLRYSILGTLLFAGSFAFMQIHWQIQTSPDCEANIDIKGNLVASNAQIRQSLSTTANTPIYTLDPEILRKKVESLAVVKHAFVRRYAIPEPKLTVEVMEELPWATVYTDSQAPADFVLAESGKVIPIQQFPTIIQPPLKIYAKNPEQLNLNANNIERWANWRAYIEKQSQSQVLAIDLRDRNDVKVETNKFTLALGNPDSSLNHRLYRLASVLDILASEHKNAAYVNLGLNSNIPVKLAKKADTSSIAN